MSETLIASIIGGIATIGGAVIGALLGRKSGRKSEKKELEAQAQRSARSLQEQLVQRFGLKAERVTSSMDVLNKEGDARVVRMWRGVTAGEGQIVSHIHGSYWVTTPGGRIRAQPRLENVGHYPKEVSLVKTLNRDSECRYRVEIAGGLTKHDPPLSFDLPVEYEKAVLTDPAEVERAYAKDAFKRDYFAFDVELPIDTLQLEITFPNEIPAKVYPGVFYGWSEHMHDAELQRVREGFEKIQNGARFTIPEPLVGFRYVIYWSLRS